MKIYISGDTSGFHHGKEARTRFDEAESFLKRLKYDPVNPFKIKQDSLVPWLERLAALSVCDSIFLLSGWLSIPESQFEKFYSTVTGKEILFESRIDEENKISAQEEISIFRIKGAIREVTDLEFDKYIEENRTSEIYFARMLFAINCDKAGINSKRIIKYLPRDRTTILHMLKKYPDEYKYNHEFRKIADKVSQLLYPGAYQEA
jgi:hypothetical protein